ncbi:metallophosphoesterase [Paracoccus sp. p3-h83]|uniref:metallophosphoesterase n=1 Tax=Paracoccus sp. p3-h83 TaxID=3342805 RepID=UPI0035BACA19
MRIYAIGDIHGHLDLLRAAHQRIAADRALTGDASAPVVHIGDLVDRGPDSRGVIQHLIDGQRAGQPWVVLKGNHDRMFLGYLDDPHFRDPGLKSDKGWLNPALGGDATLRSYGVANPGDRPIGPVHAEARAAVPPAHRDWLTRLPTIHSHPLAVFAHAGIRPGVALHDQIEDDLVWIREPFLSDERDHGRLIVHGHTAIKAATHYGNRLNIDSSVAYGGPLSAVVIEPDGVFLLTDDGRQALRS